MIETVRWFLWVDPPVNTEMYIIYQATNMWLWRPHSEYGRQGLSAMVLCSNPAWAALTRACTVSRLLWTGEQGTPPHPTQCTQWAGLVQQRPEVCRKWGFWFLFCLPPASKERKGRNETPLVVYICLCRFRSNVVQIIDKSCTQTLLTLSKTHSELVAAALTGRTEASFRMVKKVTYSQNLNLAALLM